MNDYFDQLESELKGALSRRAHIPWYARLRLPVRHRGLAVLVAALVIATPTVAAVGAVNGWFSPGKPGIYYPASSTSGLGKVLPKGDRLLPIRAADPDGGPPWGIRLVKTNRNATCIQVGRVVGGQIGQLGIDTAWHDDHEFHEIKPNDQLADICGSTDGAGNGFANQGAYGAPASVDVPLYNSGGGPGRCLSPFAGSPLGGPRGRPVPPALKRRLKTIEQQRAASQACPVSGMRMIFAGLLGPRATSITYRTPSGDTKTERTAGGVGAYLIVFRETASNCQDFTQTAFNGGVQGCQSEGSGGGGPGSGADLQTPTPVTSVSYNDGKTCSVVVSQSLTAAWRALGSRTRTESEKQARKTDAGFLASHHLTRRTLLGALLPRCPPVGWVAPKGPKLTAAQVASPVKLKLAVGSRFCGNAHQIGTFDGMVPCDGRVPAGDRFIYATRPAHKAVLVTVSFTARQPITTNSSSYEWAIKAPGNNGVSGGGTTTNIRVGQRVTLSMFEPIKPVGTFTGAVAFVKNAGQGGQPTGDLAGEMDTKPHGLAKVAAGTLIVARFSFKMPPHH
jgi:hypothetical protein